jgi:uncharacterized surface protein with fasciclin (FAS1) repeats
MKLQLRLTLITAMGLFLATHTASAQTNVFDDVIATSPDHTSLTAALEAAELDDDLQNDAATFTVFAPDNDAFDDLATQLGLTIPELLELENLADILLYHVLDGQVLAADIENGDLVTPLNPANTIKLTATSGGDVFANQAQVNAPDLTAENGVVHSLDAVILSDETVVDIAIDNGFSTLATAVITAELLPALTDPFAEFTVFAPSNDAFEDLATALGTDLDGILALPNLTDVLTYHVLPFSVEASMINNGDIETPINNANTVKLTATSGGDVFVNQAQVEIADLTAANGIVHTLDAALLPDETVADIAIDNGFTTLTTAVVTAELLPVLTDPFAEFTVFAPDNDAFEDLAEELETDIDGLLANPDLADILTYHVLPFEITSDVISNGDIETPVNNANTVKLTVTSGGDVFVNQAQVEIPDLTAGNGTVHTIDAVILSSETVADVAIDNEFTTLTGAVVTAELLPALTDPFAELTVFAPTNDAFDDLATALGTDLDGILALPNLGDILLYHVAGEELLAAELMNGELTMLNGENTLVDLSDGVEINNATVTGPDNTADNGVVHIIDAVLSQDFLSVDNLQEVNIDIYPNPAVDFLRIENFDQGNYSIINIAGALVKQGVLNGTREINLSDLEEGVYLINVRNDEEISTARFVKLQ